MSILDTDLFSTPAPAALGVGFHNVGSGVLRASHEAMVRQVERHYGERCGHLPLSARNIRVLVEQQSAAVRAQMDYLSQLFGKPVIPRTIGELKMEQEEMATGAILVVPYINVPETEAYLHAALDTHIWGLPARMTHALKNKVNFYQLAGEFNPEGFRPPDYIVSTLFDLTREAAKFLSKVEDIYAHAGVANAYPLGVMLRAAESDGNYGCCLVHETAAGINLVPNGDVEQAEFFANWREALAASQRHLAATMNTQKEERIVISRFIEFADSPGLSVVIVEGKVESLGWNSQLQKEGSKACIGTSTYLPKNSHLRHMQQQYEEQTAAFLEAFLRKTAQKCGIDFSSIRGVANVDIMIPGELERELQNIRKQPEDIYLAECNPRWTNYTDAIMAVLGANRKAQTIRNMKATIQSGICTFDKYPLPAGVDPALARTILAERDDMLKREGTRIICRMPKNPLGLILAGDLKRAQQAVQNVFSVLATG